MTAVASHGRSQETRRTLSRFAQKLCKGSKMDWVKVVDANELRAGKQLLQQRGMGTWIDTQKRWKPG